MATVTAGLGTILSSGSSTCQQVGYDSVLARHLLYILIASGLVAQTPDHLGNIRQLTAGGENAEAYWSPDSKQIIFQSTRDKLACDQIFIMNADGSNQHMVSTGRGRTTCGYFLADHKHILYASTHESGDA
jgi:TolB protein